MDNLLRDRLLAALVEKYKQDFLSLTTAEIEGLQREALLRAAEEVGLRLQVPAVAAAQTTAGGKPDPVRSARQREVWARRRAAAAAKNGSAATGVVEQIGG